MHRDPDDLDLLERNKAQKSAPSLETLSDISVVKEAVIELCEAAGPGSEAMGSAMAKRLAEITDNSNGLMVRLPRTKAPQPTVGGLGLMTRLVGMPNAACRLLDMAGVKLGGFAWPEAHVAVAATWVLMGAEHSYQCACCQAAMDFRANAFDSLRIMLGRAPRVLAQFTPLMHAGLGLERKQLLETLVNNWDRLGAVKG